MSTASLGGSDCTYIGSYTGIRGGGDLLGYVAMDEDIAWGRDGDDPLGYMGVRRSKPENLSKMGMLMDDDEVERYLV